MARELEQPEIIKVDPLTHSEASSVTLQREPDGKWSGSTTVQKGRMKDGAFVSDPQFTVNYNVMGLDLSQAMTPDDMSQAIADKAQKRDALIKAANEARAVAEQLQREVR